MTELSAPRGQVWCITKGRCWYCGLQCQWRTTERRRQFSTSYLTPRTRGGSEDASNRVLSCRPCRERKATKTLEEFRASETRRRLEHQAMQAHADAAGVDIPTLQPGPWDLPVTFWGEEPYACNEPSCKA